jgi:hypothetical protein
MHATSPTVYRNEGISSGAPEVLLAFRFFATTSASRDAE